jgi:hypothetical protein
MNINGNNPMAIKILLRAADLAEQGKTCKDVLALDSTGHRINPLDKRAERWCAVGLLYKAALDLQLLTLPEMVFITNDSPEQTTARFNPALQEAIDRLTDIVDYRSRLTGNVEFISSWNDRCYTSSDDIARALRAAATIEYQPRHNITINNDQEFTDLPF